jgi:hypothetical protein
MPLKIHSPVVTPIPVAPYATFFCRAKKTRSQKHPPPQHTHCLVYVRLAQTRSQIWGRFGYKRILSASSLVARKSSCSAKFVPLATTCIVLVSFRAQTRLGGTRNRSQSHSASCRCHRACMSKLGLGSSDGSASIFTSGFKGLDVARGMNRRFKQLQCISNGA